MAEQAGTLSVADVNFLRKLTRDQAFRKQYFGAKPQGRVDLAKKEGVPLASSAVARIGPAEIDGLYRAANAVGSAAADDNCTLVYALVFAVAFALVAADTARGLGAVIRE